MARVSVDKDGKVKVQRVDCVIDCGRVVNAALTFFSQRIDGVCLTSTLTKPAALSICFNASSVGSEQNS